MIYKGKKYVYSGAYSTRTTALKHAKSERDRNYLARVR